MGYHSQDMLFHACLFGLLLVTLLLPVPTSGCFLQFRLYNRTDVFCTQPEVQSAELFIGDTRMPSFFGDMRADCSAKQLEVWKANQRVVLSNRQCTYVPQADQYAIATFTSGEGLCGYLLAKFETNNNCSGQPDSLGGGFAYPDGNCTALDALASVKVDCKEQTVSAFSGNLCTGEPIQHFEGGSCTRMTLNGEQVWVDTLFYAGSPEAGGQAALTSWTATLLHSAPFLSSFFRSS